MAKSQIDKRVHSIAVGQGLYTAELASAIPDGYLPIVSNFIASGQTLENRAGFAQTTVDYSDERQWYNNFNRMYVIEHADEDQACLAWANLNEFHFIRSGTSILADPYINVTLGGLNASGDVTSFVRYQDNVYFTYIDYVGVTCKLYKITDFDWATDSITYSEVTGLPAFMTGMFFFKDRMWTFSADKLFFSELVTIASPDPETWPSTNYIRFNAHKGFYDILQVIPLGNRLMVFTAGGLYSLLVEGVPAAWSRRLLDSTAKAYSGQTGFEANGLVYYATNTGVYVTNGSYTTKISSVIEDVFTTNTNDVKPSLHYLADGMLLTFHRLVKAAGSGLVYYGDAFKAFYSKLDPIAWTKWTLDDASGVYNEYADQYIAEIHSIATAVATGLSNTPLTFIQLSTTRCTSTTGDLPAIKQLVVYDGGSDELKVQNEALAIETLSQPIVLNFVTRFTDAESILNLKRSYEGMIEIFSSDDAFNFTTKFEIDGYESYVAELPTTESTVGVGINLVRIIADFRFRRVAAHFTAPVGTDTTQIKVSSIHLVVDDTRKEFERVR